MQPHYVKLKGAPSPKREYVLEHSNLCGGINLWDPDYRLKNNESPEMKNLLWRNGMLCSRKGQRFLCEYQLGQGFAAYPRLWHGCIFAHIGANIFCFRVEEARSESSASGAETTDATISDVYPRLNESGTETAAESGFVAQRVGSLRLPSSLPPAFRRFVARFLPSATSFTTKPREPIKRSLPIR